MKYTVKNAPKEALILGYGSLNSEHSVKRFLSKETIATKSTMILPGYRRALNVYSQWQQNTVYAGKDKKTGLILAPQFAMIYMGIIPNDKYDTTLVAYESHDQNEIKGFISREGLYSVIDISALLPDYDGKLPALLAIQEPDSTMPPEFDCRCTQQYINACFGDKFEFKDEVVSQLGDTLTDGTVVSFKGDKY